MQVFYEFNVLACTHFMFFSSWAVELAPTNTLVTPFCCNIQASAISASVSSLSPASAFHFLSCYSSSGVRAECFRKCSFAIRLSAGIPLRYRSVRSPCARGENEMKPMPFSAQ